MISLLHENEESRMVQSAGSQTVVSPLNSKIRYIIWVFSHSFLKTKNNNMAKQISPKMTINFFFIPKPNR